MELITKKSDCKIPRELIVKSPKEIKKKMAKTGDASGRMVKPFLISLASDGTLILGHVASNNYSEN